MIPDLDARVISMRTTVARRVAAGRREGDFGRAGEVPRPHAWPGTDGLHRQAPAAPRSSSNFRSPISIEEALLNVNNALSQVPGYPENVDQPSIKAEAFSSNSFMYFRLMPDCRRLFSEDDSHPSCATGPRNMCKRRWSGCRGYPASACAAARERQVKHLCRPGQAGRARHPPQRDVRTVIRGRNRDVSGGDLDSGKRRYLLRTIGRFETVEQLENLVIAEQDGAFIRLRDRRPRRARLCRGAQLCLFRGASRSSHSRSAARSAANVIRDQKRDMLEDGWPS